MRAGSGAARIALLPLLFAGFASAPSARPASPDGNDELLEIIREQRALIDSQKKALETLRQRVDRLEEKTVQEAARIETVDHHVDEALGEVEGIDLTRETDQMAGARGLQLTIPRVKTTVTVAGFVKADLIHDFREINAPQGERHEARNGIALEAHR